MYRKGLPIDLNTVYDYLVNVKKIKTFGDDNAAYYCSKLTNSVVSTAHLEYHALVIKRMWMERELMLITHGSLEMNGDIKEKMFTISSSIQKINAGTFSKDWYDLSELIIGLSHHQDEMITSNGMGLTTGIAQLDSINGGFFKGQMIIIGARPSVGKSAYMGQIALSMAKRGKKVGIVSLEMNNNEIAARLSSIETELDFKKIFRGLFYDENERSAWYKKISDEFIGLPIFVSDKTDVSPSSILEVL